MRYLLTLIISFFLIIPIASAEDIEAKGPLTIRNQNPVYLQFLNLTPTRAKAIKKGEMLAKMDINYSNIFERDFSATNNVLIDMELMRTALDFTYGFYDNMEVEMEIPFYHSGGGFLDSFIQKYHNFFGFPNGGRELVPNNEYNFYFTQGGTRIYDVPEQAFTLGDIALDLKYNFLEESRLMPAMAFIFYYKLPTGSRSKGTGSGNVDFGYGMAFEKSYKRLHGYLNVAYFTNGGQEELQNYINDVYFSFMTGASYSVSKVVDVVLQLNGGTPVLKGAGMSSWDSFPMDLQFGVRGSNPIGSDSSKIKAIEWQAGFTEDLNSNGPSIDFSIFGSVGIRFEI